MQIRKPLRKKSILLASTATKPNMSGKVHNLSSQNSVAKFPALWKDLLTLPGVARKTANIVLARGFGVVDGVCSQLILTSNAFQEGWDSAKTKTR